MQTWALMYAHPAILEETRRRGVHPWISTGRKMRAPDPEGQVTVIAIALARKTVGGIGLNALADGPSGGCWFWPGRHRPGTVAAIGSDVCLAERNSQQARAQEHEAGRGQGKKSVGDDVVVAHVTPTTQILARIY
jgi:hypothetical protein